MNNRYRGSRFMLFLPLVILAIFLFGEVIMLLWNNVLTPVLHVSTVTYWQGLGILVLSKILFGNFSGRGRSRGGYWKQRMMWNNMSEEQKQKFREDWKNYCGGRGYRSWNRDTEVEQAGPTENI